MTSGSLLPIAWSESRAYYVVEVPEDAADEAYEHHHMLVGLVELLDLSHGRSQGKHHTDSLVSKRPTSMAKRLMPVNGAMPDMLKGRVTG